MSLLDEPLVRAFEAATLQPNEFGHRQHLYVAWCYLETLPLEAALARYVHHLQQLTRALGVPHKYHATLTWAYLLLLHEALQDAALAAGSFDDLLRAEPRLLDPSHALVLEHYGQVQLDSPAARQRFVLPLR
jgi:hypothetical protein